MNETASESPFYIDPLQFKPRMERNGWQVSLEQGLDGDPDKVRYVLHRPLEFGFDHNGYWQFLLESGIVRDQDQYTDGYQSVTYYVNVPEHERPVGHPMEFQCLSFSYEGYVDEQVLANLDALERHFARPRGRLGRLLGRFSGMQA
ncbi:MAG TPA: hypothetical protein VF996_02210 [Candidatus Saccharimonadales bacterium]